MDALAATGTLRDDAQHEPTKFGLFRGDLRESDGLRHGEGQYTFPNPFFRYVGEWFDGMMHGTSFNKETRRDEASGVNGCETEARHRGAVVVGVGGGGWEESEGGKEKEVRGVSTVARTFNRTYTYLATPPPLAATPTPPH